MVPDPAPPVSSLPKVARSLTCFDRHIGLCQRQAGQWLDVILRACCNINTVCHAWPKTDLLGNVLCITACYADSREVQSQFVVADARFGNPVVQIFCKTQQLLDNHLQLAREIDGSFELGTSFECMHEFLESNAQGMVVDHIHLRDLQVTPCSGQTPFYLHVDNLE